MLLFLVSFSGRANVLVVSLPVCYLTFFAAVVKFLARATSELIDRLGDLAGRVVARRIIAIDARQAVCDLTTSRTFRLLRLVLSIVRTGEM